MAPSQRKAAHEPPCKEIQGQRQLKQESGNSQVYTWIGDRLPSLNSASMVNKPLQDLGKDEQLPN